MEKGVQGSTNKDYNRSAHNYMLQRQAPSSSSSDTDHLTSRIPLNYQSRLITKQPHKIRIIHLVPPKIIQTDKASFKDLVQRLTGRSSSLISSTKTTGRIRKHQKPQVISSSDTKMISNYQLGFDGSNSNSSNTAISSNETSLDDPYDHHVQLNMDVTSVHDEMLIGGLVQANNVWNNYDQMRNAKDERGEMMVQEAQDYTEWGVIKDKLEIGFCIDGFLELDEWLSQDIKLPVIR